MVKNLEIPKKYSGVLLAIAVGGVTSATFDFRCVC